jgi:hypothetical protein
LLAVTANESVKHSRDRDLSRSLFYVFLRVAEPQANGVTSTFAAARMLSKPPEGVGRQAKDALKGPREVEGIAKIHFLSHLFHQRSRLLQQFGGQIHSQTQ